MQPRWGWGGSWSFPGVLGAGQRVAAEALAEGQVLAEAGLRAGLRGFQAPEALGPVQEKPSRLWGEAAASARASFPGITRRTATSLPRQPRVGTIPSSEHLQAISEMVHHATVSRPTLGLHVHETGSTPRAERAQDEPSRSRGLLPASPRQVWDANPTPSCSPRPFTLPPHCSLSTATLCQVREQGKRREGRGFTRRSLS